ncbi:uncharacterized protein LOC111831700 [Capsella rubella]|uniref:uncharacterized protein LOC111831700 n=1 Tax=Capsella rubella TaxID=81985 RepID=UPI000CD53B92|nr:uncharacterized protein LOC111831700 [Capsella rubella]
MVNMMSIKFAFVVFFAVTSVMNIVTVQNVEGKRLLPEEYSQFVLDHHDEASPSIVTPHSFRKFHCDQKCHVQCIIRESMFNCICVC